MLKNAVARISAIILISLSALIIVPSAANAVPNAPTLESPVIDETGTLTKDDLKEIGKAAGNISADGERGVGEIAIYMTSDLNGKSIEEAANELARSWGIGTKANDGVLLYIAKDDREFRWEIARKAGEYFTDADSKRVLQTMVPHFKQDDYAMGIIVGVEGAREYLNGMSATEREEANAVALAEYKAHTAKVFTWSGIVFGVFLGGSGIVAVILGFKSRAKKKEADRIAAEKAEERRLWLLSPEGIKWQRDEKLRKERELAERKRKAEERRLWLLTPDGRKWQAEEDERKREQAIAAATAALVAQIAANRRREEESRNSSSSSFGGFGSSSSDSSSSFGGGGGFDGGGSSSSW